MARSALHQQAAAGRTKAPQERTTLALDRLIHERLRLGIVSARAKSIIALARVQISGELSLDTGAHHNPEDSVKRLAELPGIGLWTAHYIAMRAMRWPDAFLKEDIVVRKNLGGVTAKQAEEMSQEWRPWRSYAVLYIWRNSPTPTGVLELEVAN